MFRANHESSSRIEICSMGSHEYCRFVVCTLVFCTNVHWDSSFKIGSIVASLDNPSAVWHFLQAFEGITITTKFISFPLWKLAMWGFRVENLTSFPPTRFQAPCYAVGTDFSNGGRQNIEKYAPKKQTSPPLSQNGGLTGCCSWCWSIWHDGLWFWVSCWQCSEGALLKDCSGHSSEIVDQNGGSPLY